MLKSQDLAHSVGHVLHIKERGHRVVAEHITKKMMQSIAQPRSLS